MLLIGNISIVNKYRKTPDGACHELQISRDLDTLSQDVHVLGVAHCIFMTVLEPILPDPLQPQTCLLIRSLQYAENLVLPVLLHSRVQRGCLRVDVAFGLSSGERTPESRLQLLLQTRQLMIALCEIIVIFKVPRVPLLY